MKNIFVSIFLFLSLSSLTILTSIGIYTEDQKDKLIDLMIKYYEPFEIIDVNGEEAIYSKEIQPLHLHNLLYANIYAQKPEDALNWAAGDRTSIVYQEKWRDVVKNNPDLLYKIWELMGDDAILSINSKLGYFGSTKSDSEKFHVQTFKTSEFWQAQKNLIRKYQKLISELLKLDDKRLNFFISSTIMYDDAKCFDFNQWLKERDLLTCSSVQTANAQNASVNNCYVYPGDLILLTNRVKQASKDWTPRKFLTEVNKFATLLLTSIDKNID